MQNIFTYHNKMFYSFLSKTKKELIFSAKYSNSYQSSIFYMKLFRWEDFRWPSWQWFRVGTVPKSEKALEELSHSS